MASESFHWIGKPLPRVEDERLMRGAGHFIDDLAPFPGCKEAAIVRSPYAHAIIRQIDVEQALQIPGVIGVITGTDIKREMRPFPVGVPAPVEYYPLAIEKVRFAGEPVAVPLPPRSERSNFPSRVALPPLPLPWMHLSGLRPLCLVVQQVSVHCRSYPNA